MLSRVRWGPWWSPSASQNHRGVGSSMRWGSWYISVPAMVTSYLVSSSGCSLNFPYETQIFWALCLIMHVDKPTWQCSTVTCKIPYWMKVEVQARLQPLARAQWPFLFLCSCSSVHEVWLGYVLFRVVLACALIKRSQGFTTSDYRIPARPIQYYCRCHRLKFHCFFLSEPCDHTILVQVQAMGRLCSCLSENVLSTKRNQTRLADCLCYYQLRGTRSLFWYFPTADW